LSLELQVLWAQELSGIAAAVVALTSEYVKTRTQFGKQIGSFQAVQHTLSDMYSRAEASRSLSQFAAWSLAAKQDQGELAGRAALAFATKEVPAIVESAIQLHGGIGFTWEHDLHLYLRRAQFLSLLAQVDEAATAAFLETAQRS
jgi:alkylation response protein AidB-like acyl-CoA dehydrogenase